MLSCSTAVLTRLQNITIFFGVAYCTVDGDSQTAYNFYLTPGAKSLSWFDPQGPGEVTNAEFKADIGMY